MNALLNIGFKEEALLDLFTGELAIFVINPSV
jgi:hypothetical protein